MNDACLCTAHDAAHCEGGGLPPAPDGGCSCACHDGAEATDAIATESTEAVLIRERDEARAERDALLRARDHELHWDPNLSNDPNGPVPSDPIELRERFYRLRWALYSLGPELRAFNMLARLHRLDPSSANAERLVNLVGAEHEDLRVARREREAIAAVCGLAACPSICLEALAPAVAKLDAERAALQAKANELPGLTATLDELRWELKVARGDATAGAQALAMIERTNEENTDILMRHIDTKIALEETMRVGLEECESLRAQLASVTAERDRLQRACDEGLPRECFACPRCGAPHIDGPRHDNPAVDGSRRPHHEHFCPACKHVWERGWTFGVAAGAESPVVLRLRAEGVAAALEIVQASNREAYALHRKDTADATAGTIAAWTDEMVREVAALLPDDQPEVSRG